MIKFSGSGVRYMTLSTIRCLMIYWCRGPCKGIEGVQGGCYFASPFLYKLVNGKGRRQVVLYCRDTYIRQYFCFSILNVMLFLVFSCLLLFLCVFWIDIRFVLVFCVSCFVFMFSLWRLIGCKCVFEF